MYNSLKDKLEKYIKVWRTEELSQHKQKEKI